MEDKELVSKILEGDTMLYSEVVKRYSGMIFSKVLGLMKRQDFAKEITQQAFVRAYINLDSWRGEVLGPWLAAVAIHLSLNALEKERRRRTEDIDRVVEATPEDFSKEREELLQKMEQVIEELPPNDREIIKQHYFEGIKADEIAQRLGMTTSNVLVKLHRIRERLKKGIENERAKR